MKALKTLALAAAACAFTAGSAQAAFHPTGTGLMNFLGEFGPSGLFEVGSTPFRENTAPYSASFNIQRTAGDGDLLPGLVTGSLGPFGNPYDIFCIDMINTITIHAPSNPYASYFTNLGSDLASVGFSTRNHTQQEYKEAAYLASMWSGLAGHENVIQGAIWYVMNGAANITAAWDGSTFVDLATYTSAAFGVGDANVNAWYGTGAAEEWVVVTPENAATLYKGGNQEQLVHVSAVPEPATMLLLGTGLAIMLFGTGYIRRFTA